MVYGQGVGKTAGVTGSRRRRDQCRELGMEGLGRKREPRRMPSAKAVSKDNTFE